MTLIDPGYVREGKHWPPVSESARIRRAESNLRLYRGDFSELSTPADQSRQLRFQAGQDTPQIRITVNMFRWISRAWADLIFGNPPVLDYIDVEESYANEGRAVLRRLKKATPGLTRAGRQVVKNCVRYGVGVFVSRKPGMIESVDPRFWFPVVAPDDANDIRGHIIAYPYVSDPNSTRLDNTTPRGTARTTAWSTPDRLHVYRFTMDMEGMWTCESCSFHYTGTSVGEMIGGWEQMPCAQPPVTTVVLEGDDIYGESLFDDLRSQVAEINLRETRISEALDKHANPHLAVPEGSLSVDQNGRAVISASGDALFVPEGSTNPEYIVWDPKFDAHVEAVIRAERRIASMAGISQLLVNVSGGNSAGQRLYLPSGVALRRLALLTVQRIRSYRSDMEEALQGIIAGALSDAYSLEQDRINISWPPPLDDNSPDDTDELVSLIQAGVIDRVDAAQQVNRVPRTEAKRIAEEAQPVQGQMQPFGGGNMNQGGNQGMDDGEE